MSDIGSENIQPNITSERHGFVSKVTGGFRRMFSNSNKSTPAGVNPSEQRQDLNELNPFVSAPKKSTSVDPIYNSASAVETKKAWATQGGDARSILDTRGDTNQTLSERTPYDPYDKIVQEKTGDDLRNEANKRAEAVRQALAASNKSADIQTGIINNPAKPTAI